jgi:hypothetical protein
MSNGYTHHAAAITELFRVTVLLSKHFSLLILRMVTAKLSISRFSTRMILSPSINVYIMADDNVAWRLGAVV